MFSKIPVFCRKFWKKCTFFRFLDTFFHFLHGNASYFTAAVKYTMMHRHVKKQRNRAGAVTTPGRRRVWGLLEGADEQLAERVSKKTNVCRLVYCIDVEKVRAKKRRTCKKKHEVSCSEGCAFFSRKFKVKTVTLTNLVKKSKKRERGW